MFVFKRCLHGLSPANPQQHLCPALPKCVGGLVTAWLCSVIICPFLPLPWSILPPFQLLCPPLQFFCPSFSFIPGTPSPPEILPFICKDFHYLTKHFSFPFKALNFPDSWEISRGDRVLEHVAFYGKRKWQTPIAMDTSQNSHPLWVWDTNSSLFHF